MKRRVPRLTTDEQAEAFLDSDLSNLDFSQFKSGRLRLRERFGSARGTRFTLGTRSSQSSIVTTEQQAAEIEEPTPSETYRLFGQAMIDRKQIVCMYNGRRREVCPIILGHTQGEERALTYQFTGGSSSKLPLGGEWRCLTLSNVSEVQLRDGPWYSGDSHKQPSGCVQVVDLDVNPDSPYNPKRRLQSVYPAKSAGRDRKRSAPQRGRKT
jgi:hypothetical protein